MDSKIRDAKIMPLISDLEPQKEAEEEVSGDDEKESESETLLPPRKGGISQESPKTRRKVHWKDITSGSKLAEILEFQPSDASDSDEDDSDPCLCTIM